jgi:predicted nucleic acid-binding protein
MTIVDTSVWIDFLNQRGTPQTVWLLGGHENEPIGLTSLVLTEALQGIRLESRFQQALTHFRSIPVFNGVSPELAVLSAQNFRTLRSRGVTVRSTIDCLLATFCIVNGYGLLHNDRDFDAFERHLGLDVKHPPAIPLN